MSDVLKLKAFVNKKNKQINFSLKKKNLSPELKKIMQGKISGRILKLKFEGFE